MVGVEWKEKKEMSEVSRLWLAGTPMQVQCWTPCLGEAPALSRGPRSGTGTPQPWWSDGRKPSTAACGGLGKQEPVLRGRPAPVNSLTGLRGPQSLPEKRWGPAACCPPPCKAGPASRVGLPPAGGQAYSSS